MYCHQTAGQNHDVKTDNKSFENGAIEIAFMKKLKAH